MKKASLFLLIAILLLGCQKQDKEEPLILKEVKIEYGEEVSYNILDYLDRDALNKEKQDDIIKNAKISISDLEFEDKKVYPKINTYEVLVEYLKETYKTQLIVVDTVAPVFNDVKKIELDQGNQDYDFSKNIKASDLQTITYDFQKDKINFKKAGSYIMKALAKDASGNETSKDITVIIKEQKTTKPTSQENVQSQKLKYPQSTGNQQLDAICDQILDTIITDSMNDKQKAYAVYQWVEKNIRYSGSMAVTNWKTGAVSSLKYRKGNCLAFCYSSEALLTRLGFENIEVHDRELTHYWNMIKINNAWYHFDTTSGWGKERFLWTNQQLKDYRYDSPILNSTIDYDWDMSAYPTTP